MANITGETDAGRAASARRHYLIRFEEDTLVIGAAIAVMLIGAVRGLPSKEEREAAESGALPILGGRSRRNP